MLSLAGGPLKDDLTRVDVIPSEPVMLKVNTDFSSYPIPALVYPRPYLPLHINAHVYTSGHTPKPIKPTLINNPSTDMYFAVVAISTGDMEEKSYDLHLSYGIP